MKTDNNRIAIVTGGFGLLGRQHVLALQEIGCFVYVLDESKKDLGQFMSIIENEGDSGKVKTLLIDLKSERQIKLAIKSIVDVEGGIDILVNNAALNPKPSVGQRVKKLENFSVRGWNEEVSVGLTSYILMTKYCAPYMSWGGVIVNISSDLSIISPDQRVYESLGQDVNGEFFVKPISYSVIKTGLLGLTRYLATYLAKDGIRVNALSPGGVYAEQDSSLVKAIEGLIPLGRMAFVSEYRGAIKFLCTEESSYMTGQNLVIDGGRTVW
jgi:NAD(P)-dependent dehydrogenase (short-subunit alcohol dehydrogenase family)